MTSKMQPPVINGWSVYLHELIVEEMSRLLDFIKAKHASGEASAKLENYKKRLTILRRIIFEIVPENPGSPSHRLGKTLGPGYVGWFRVNFLQQYRLFYRYDSAHKVIVHVWLNDERTLRAYGSKTDAYKVFKKMLDSGYPPQDMKTLIEQSKDS